VHGGPSIVIVAKDPGDLKNVAQNPTPQILRQQNLVSGTHVGALIVFCALVVKVA
jgi:hypothetical protein